MMAEGEARLRRHRHHCHQPPGAGGACRVAQAADHLPEAVRADSGRCQGDGRCLPQGGRPADGAREFPLAVTDPGGQGGDRVRRDRRAVLRSHLVPLGLRRVLRPALSRRGQALHHRGSRHPYPRHRALPVRRRDDADGAHAAHNPEIKGEDVATMLLDHENGTTSVVDCSYATKLAVEPFPETLVEIDGSEGTIRLAQGYRLTVTGKSGTTERDVSPPLLPWASRPWHNIQESVAAIQQHWVDCLRAAVRRRRPAPTISRPSRLSRLPMPARRVASRSGSRTCSDERRLRPHRHACGARPEPVRLVAGPLTADLVNGNLRAIRYGGIEVLRAIAYVVRDRDWGTYEPAITDLRLDQDAMRFSVSYDAQCAGPDGARLRLFGADRGRGRRQPDLRPRRRSPTATSKPTAAASACCIRSSASPARRSAVEHVDGSGRRDRAAGTDRSLAAVQGDAGDHAYRAGRPRRRNAGWKATRSRWRTSATGPTPPTRPMCARWRCLGPTCCRPASSSTQTITLRFCGSRRGSAGFAAASGAASASNSATLGPPAAGDRRRCLPGGGAERRWRPRPVAGTGAAGAAVRTSTRRAGHGAPALARLRPSLPRPTRPPHTRMRRALRGRSRCRDGGAGRADRVMRACARQPSRCRRRSTVSRRRRAASGRTVRRWTTSMLQRGVPFPGCGSAAGCSATSPSSTASACLPSNSISSRHCTCPIVHAADDLSASCSRWRRCPSSRRSVRAIYGDKPYRIGPSTIAMRQNPYGSATKDNPDLSASPWPTAIPATTALFAAAWAVGYAARVAPAGLEQLYCCAFCRSLRTSRRGERAGRARGNAAVVPYRRGACRTGRHAVDCRENRR